MKKNWKIYAVVLAVVMTAGAFSAQAQESVVMLMKDLPQQTKYNPALASSSRSYFVLPGLGGFSVSIENTAFSFEDLYVHDKKKDSWTLNLDHLAKNFKGSNDVLHMELDVPIVSTGIRLPKGALYWSISNKSKAEVTLPKSILNLRYGNYDFAKSKPISHDLSDLGVKMMNYNEIALGGHVEINGHLAIGASIKYLSGLASLHTDNMSLKIETLDKGGKYSMHVKSRGDINISAPVTIKNNEDGYVDEMDLDVAGIPDFMTKNSGFAFDLGVRMSLVDNRLRLGVSAIDLGRINWKVDINQLKADADFVYEGMDLSNMLVDVDEERDKKYWDEIGDELSKFKDVRSASGKSFKTVLTPTFLAFGQWEVQKWFNVGAVSSMKIVNGSALSKTTANISLRPNYHFEFLVSGGVHPGGSMGVGGGIQATAGAFQFMVASERLDLHIKRAKGAQLTFGINWLIGAGSGDNIEDEKPAVEIAPQPIE